jgi:hypothetical protein
MLIALTWLLLGLPGSASAFAKDISTNEIAMHDAPAWLSSSRIDNVVSKIQDFMEWDIRKIQVHWYTDQAAFEAVHGMGSYPIAVSMRADNSMHLGPKVTDGEFDSTFGHELVHIILYQKYKTAIPSWLDEGLANYVGQHGKVDYKWLSKQRLVDVTTLTHPFKGPSADGSADVARVHYQTAQALMEMIAAKCEIHDLLQLSVGKKLETYLGTYCDIADLNDAFRKWVKRKSQ